MPVVFAAFFFVPPQARAMVAGAMRTRFDQFGKQMVRTALETRGLVETDAEVPADTRRIDLRWLTVPSDPAKQTTDDQELLMDTQDIVDTWRREAIQEGVRQGLQQGREEGLQQGVAHALVEVYEARFGAMPADLRAVVAGTQDEATLVTWLRLAGTRNADEIAAAIRSSCAS